MSSPACQVGISEKCISSLRHSSLAGFKVEAPIGRAGNALAAHSFEFVAKPEEAASALLSLPGAIHSGLEDISGFAGSLVMVSDQEARLITVIIFWSGTEWRRSCERSVRRVRALLSPYMDRCLRVQNLVAHAPKAQDFPQPSSIDSCFIGEESVAQEAHICTA